MCNSSTGTCLWPFSCISFSGTCQAKMSWNIFIQTKCLTNILAIAALIHAHSTSKNDIEKYILFFDFFALEYNMQELIYNSVIEI